MAEKRKLHLEKIKMRKYKSKTPLPRKSKTEYKQLITGNADYGDDSSVISVKNVVDTVSGTASAVKMAKEVGEKVYSGGVKGANGARKIAARVNRLKNTPLTSKNVRHIAGRVGRTGLTFAKKCAVGNIQNTGKKALDIRDKILSASIDKSKVTDTGMETINQGITYVRYADNARRAVINTEKGTVKAIKTSVEAGKKIKSLPKDTVNSVRQAKQTIRNTAVKTKQTAKAIADAGKKAASFVGKAVTSKAFPVILAAAAIILIVVLISNFISSLIMMIGGVFSWAGEDDSDTSYKKQIEKYIDTVKEIVRDEQEKIDDVVLRF